MKNLLGRNRPVTGQHHIDWKKWRQQPLALRLLAQEKALLTPMVQRKLGTYLLQLSMAGSTPMYESSPISHQCFAHVSFAGDGTGLDRQSDLVIEPDFLPVANESLDAIILHHILEYADNPHQILREAHRALASGGQLFIVSFNPWSLMGVRKLFTPLGHAPWSGRYRSRGKISDWLKLLGFKIERTQYAFFSLPFNSSRQAADTGLVELVGQKSNCFLGSTCAMVARKQTVGLTPLRETLLKRQVLNFPVTEPTIRSTRSFE